MVTFDGLLYGLQVLFTYQNLLAAFAGALLGTIIGVLPGLGPVAGIAMILPITYSLHPTAGIIMMAGIFYGAMYGGSTTAVLINMPGESASVMTCIDGHQLTKKGRAGAVLTIVAVGSFIGGSIAVAGVMLFAPALGKFGILFGPAEFFALTAGGLLSPDGLVETESLMNELLRGHRPDFLGQIGAEHLHGGGKRVRARLALAAAEAREVGHVERERRPEADHRGERGREHRHELRHRVELAGLREQRAEAVRGLHRPHQQRTEWERHHRTCGESCGRGQ